MNGVNVYQYLRTNQADAATAHAYPLSPLWGLQQRFSSHTKAFFLPLAWQSRGGAKPCTRQAGCAREFTPKNDPQPNKCWWINIPTSLALYGKTQAHAKLSTQTSSGKTQTKTGKSAHWEIRFLALQKSYEGYSKFNREWKATRGDPSGSWAGSSQRTTTCPHAHASVPYSTWTIIKRHVTFPCTVSH